MPGKWFWGLIPLALPLAGAWFVDTPPMIDEIRSNAAANLQSAGFADFKLEMDGRDAILSGEAYSADDIGKAAKAVAAAHGVRLVATGNMKVAAPVILDAPTVKSASVNDPAATISGTWPEKTAKTLKVTVAGKQYELGRDKELTSDGAGNWSLNPSVPLKDGKYDVEVTITDGRKATASDATSNEIIIDSTPPAAPGISTIKSAQPMPVIKGTWAENDAVSLKIGLAGENYELGKDKQLKSDGKGNWSLTPKAPLADGSYDVTVTTADAFGNTSFQTSKAAVIIDTKGPSAAMIAPFAGASAMPLLSGTWPGGDTGLEIAIGDKAYALGRDKELTADGNKWNLKLAKPLADGIYDVKMSTTDKLGNVTSKVQKGAIVVDTTAPANGLISSVQGADNKPVITGRWTKAPGNSLKVDLAGNSYTLGKDKQLATSDDGKWTLTLDEALEDGRYAVTVTTGDKFGNTRKLTTPGAVVVDTTAPAIPTVTSIKDPVGKPVISGTWAEGDASDLRVVVSGKVFALGRNDQLASDGKGNWTLSLARPLADGKHTILAESADIYGNTSRMAEPKVTIVDTTRPPAAKINSVLSNDPQASISGSWSNGSGEMLEVGIDDKSWVLGKYDGLKSDDNGNWTLNPPTPLSEGVHKVTARVTDAAGNSSFSEKPDAITIDTTAPSYVTVDNVLTNSNMPVVTGKWSPEANGGLSVELDGDTYELGKSPQLTSDAAGNWKLKTSRKFGEGAYGITAKASDAAGNVSVVGKPAVLTIDTTAPDAVKIGQTITNRTMPSLSGSWSAAAGDSLYVILNNRNYTLGESSSLVSDKQGNWTLNTASPLKEGVYAVKAKAVDAAGNFAETQRDDAIIIDMTPPPQPSVTTMLTRQRRPVLTGNYKADDAASLSVTVDGKAYTMADGSVKVKGDNWALQPAAPISDGVYDVIATVTDAAGNMATDASTGELTIDATSPAIPTVKPFAAVTGDAVMVRGSWPEKSGHSLSVTFNGKTHILGSSDDLTSDGKGNWKLKVGSQLAPGSYDVAVKVADRMGNQSNDVSRGEIYIKAPKKPEPPKPAPVKVAEAPAPAKTMEAPAPAKVNCQAAFLSALSGEKIHFTTSKAVISASSKALLDRLAAAAGKCPDAKIEIGGHTDWRGSAVYNQSLSEARASAVLDALVSRGVSRGRLTAVGYGEGKPVASNKTRAGRAENRRIEFNVK